MGWVTLALRKTELKRTHATYQLEDLKISREKRRMAREYHAEQVSVENDKNSEISDIKTNYDLEKQSIYDAMSDLRTAAKEADESSSTYEYNGQTMTDLQNQLNDLKEDYTYQTGEATSYWEDELAMIEEESNDTETTLDQEQVEIETLMENVSQEMQSVSEAISSEIQNSTIKLS